MPHVRPLSLAGIVVAIFALGWSVASVRSGEKTQPVILLTGFEPFGTEKKPNPSWEGIKNLDGTTWRGHRIVARQLKVVWGSPLEQIKELVRTEKPVAIFSFGQGGGFLLETVAANERGKHGDNLGEKPASLKIVAEGPDRYVASIDTTSVIRRLRDKGHSVRESKSAGRYLCEECLYTLEYLRASKTTDAAVAFFHVPGASDPKAIGRVQTFVLDVLDAWQPEQATSVQEETKKADETSATRKKEIEELIVRYFRTWSNQDMKGYDNCFFSDAVVQFIDAQGTTSTTKRREFIAGQTNYHRTAPHRATEVPLTIDIQDDVRLSRATVYWKLTAGPRTEYGYDHFTLLKVDGEWRIINLVFYTTDKKAP